MNLARRFKPRSEWNSDVMANVERLEELWGEAGKKFGKAGKFLYGEFSAADAMYAPVVTRLDTYQLPVSKETRAYMDAILAHPAFVAWRADALKETWFLPHYEAGHEIEQSFISPKV